MSNRSVGITLASKDSNVYEINALPTTSKSSDNPKLDDEKDYKVHIWVADGSHAYSYKTEGKFVSGRAGKDTFEVNSGKPGFKCELGDDGVGILKLESDDNTILYILAAVAAYMILVKRK